MAFNRTARNLALAGLVAAAAALAAPAQAAEGCTATWSAGQTGLASCSYTATKPGVIVASSVNWKVSIVRAGGAEWVDGGNAPEVQTAAIKAGDRVTASVSGPGSIFVGSADGDGFNPPAP